ncbi:MAG TPA: metal-dependent transcriptional regulator [Vicinamibacterales bacterium]|nr:metal-dependent transcriptional regulator [Vicinamibacterales bacterium]
MLTFLTILAAVVLAAAVTVAVVRDLRRRRSVRARTQVEDALKHLFDQQYRGRHASFTSLGGVLRLNDRGMMQLLARMQHQGLVIARGQEFELTPDGERLARQIVRAHRLLERYFADEARLPLREVHAAAERDEHKLTTDQVDALSASLGHPRLDPHGDPIPGRDGEIAPAGDTPVTAWPSDKFGRITHLEDEPPLAYAQILAEGLRVGQVVRILESTPERIALTDGDHEFRLAPAVAANVFLAPASPSETAGLTTLADIPHGESAEVVSLDVNCQGFSRRRLMDLGFTPGARLEPALDTFAGDPRAYRVRGTLVALRRDQAAQVIVRPVPKSDASRKAAQ